MYTALFRPTRLLGALLIALSCASTLSAGNLLRVGPTRVHTNIQSAVNAAAADATITPAANLNNVFMQAVVEAVLCRSMWFENVTIGSAVAYNGTTSRTVVAPLGIDAGISAVQLAESVLHAQNSTFVAYDNLGAGTRYAGDAVRMIGTTSRIRFHQMLSIRGGTGSSFGGSCVHEIGGVAPQAALDYGSLVGAYVPGGGGLSGGVWAIGWDRGIVGGANRIVPAALLSSRGNMFAARKARINTSHTLVLTSGFGRNYAVYVGPTLVADLIPGFQNTPLLDYSFPLTLVAGVGVLPAAAPAAVINVAIPNSPALFGLQLSTQAVLGPPIGQTVPALSFTTGVPMVVVP